VLEVYKQVSTNETFVRFQYDGQLLKFRSGSVLAPASEFAFLVNSYQVNTKTACFE
jgi:hypothetical protein